MIYDFLISRSADDDRYAVWRVDPSSPTLLEPVALADDARFDASYRLAPVGGYLLCWRPLSLQDGWLTYPYQLLRFDPESDHPLGVAAEQRGVWPQKKFWGYRAHYGRDPKEGDALELIPLTSFVMSLIPAAGRGTFELWNFDPRPTKPGDADPLPCPYKPQEAFPTIQAGHELLPLGNYVLDRLPDKQRYRLWSFDPQGDVPLAQPVVRAGRFSDIDASHRLVPMGELLLDWRPEDRSFRLWRVDPSQADPLCGPICAGTLPEGFSATTTVTAVQPTIPRRAEQVDAPGTIDFMREHIEHVVYYMLESRSFDNVCGWLYEKGQEGVHLIGSDAPFDGASTSMANRRVDGREVQLSKFRDGKLSTDYLLEAITQDPFHGNPDTLVQMFGAPDDQQRGYAARGEPTMGGFVANNANDEVMLTFSPEQLPVINGLARGFAVSDAWFSSIPGGTDINRAFSLTGSAFNKLNTWEGGDAYAYWPKTPRRQSLFKVLWSNGITDWKIYNAVLWCDQVFTYHLYLEGQVPTIDADPSQVLGTVEQFKKDARAGELPAFSYLEPVWIAPWGTTSYHPGGDLVAGEVALNEIYEALRASPVWDKTLLVVTFDKAGGMFDHVPPPYATKPWPNDENDGFGYDLLGPRVPTVLASPWILEQTVVRAAGEVPFDATSFAATLLSWYGIPKARWGLGDRVAAAPTFETALTERAPRQDAPALTPPYDKRYPPKKS
jgi:phospholipase C